MLLETALMCMATNIYHEAKHEPLVGRIAVAQVVMNRVEDKRYPDTVCEVVKQGLTYKNGKVVIGRCMFSWYCDGRSDDINRTDPKWRDSLRIASMVITDKITLDVTEGSTHYHATYVRPAWAKTKTRIVRINKHIFYRWEK